MGKHHPGGRLAGRLQHAMTWYTRLLALCVLALALSGCMLVSGERVSADTQAAGGNISASFVSAEGTETRTLATGTPGQLEVIAIVSVDRGELRLDILDPNGSVVFSVQGRPQEQVTRSGSVPTDAEGNLYYRVVTQGARNGNYQILYQRSQQ